MGKYIGKFEKPKKKKKIGLMILLVLLALILVGLIGGVIYYQSVLNQINRFEEVETLSTEALESLFQNAMEEGSADLDENASIGTIPTELDVMTDEEEVIGGEIVNILLIGQDTRNPEQRGLSDSMILVSVNTETKTLVMTSFMRDLYIDIPADKGGYYRQRINTAYAVGGMEKLNATITHNFGVEIDNNVEVDFSGFQTIVDAMGGVDIELTKAEACLMNKESFYAWKLQEGVNHLDGEQALAYARIRSIDSDFYRTERQRVVLNKLLEKVKGMGVTDLLGLAKAFIPLITTDMTNSEITEYIMELAPLLPELEVITQRVPIDGSWWGANAGTEEQPMYVIYCNLTKNRDMLRETIGGISE